MRLRSAIGSSIPNSCNPSIASRTPSTCPAHKWPCATAASSRYSSSVFIISVSSRTSLALLGLRLRSGRLSGSPRMRLAGFHKDEDGHEQRKRGERRVFQDLLESDRFWSRKTAAIDIHVQEIRAQNNTGKPQHNDRKQWSPDAQAPANQKE